MIKAKPHAYRQALTTTPANFRRDLDRIIEGVAFTRYPSAYELVEI